MMSPPRTLVMARYCRWSSPRLPAQLGNGDTHARDTFRMVSLLSERRVASLTFGTYAAFAIERGTGAVWAWGRNTRGGRPIARGRLCWDRKKKERYHAACLPALAYCAEGREIREATQISGGGMAPLALVFALCRWPARPYRVSPGGTPQHHYFPSSTCTLAHHTACASQSSAWARRLVARCAAGITPTALFRCQHLSRLSPATPSLKSRRGLRRRREMGS